MFAPTVEEGHLVPPILVGCPRCRRQLSLPAQHSGAAFACPTCKQRITAPEPASNDGDDVFRSSLDALYRAELHAANMRPQPIISLGYRNNVARSSSPLPLLIGCVGFGIAVIVGLSCYLFLRPETSDEEITSYKVATRRNLEVKTKRSSALDNLSPPTQPAPLPKAPFQAKPSAAPSPTKLAASALPPRSHATSDPPKPRPIPKQRTGPREKLSVADLVEAVGDGVVHITVHDPDGEPFATGSGLIIAQEHINKWTEPDLKPGEKPLTGDLWLVATNYHVVAGAASATVRLRDGRTFKPRGLAAHSRERDLAILALDKAPDGLTILEPAPADSLRQGEDVVAIGHPRGFDFTVSTGIVSALRGSKELPDEVSETIDAPDDQIWIQTTAAITNGNSGGPLLSMFGEVVGINTWGYNSGGNLAFASHIKHAMELRDKAITRSEKELAVTIHQFAVAKPVEAPEKIGDRDDWLETEVREELTRSAKRVMSVDWRPSTRGDYVPFQAVATMLTIAGVYRYEVDELEGIRDSVAKRKWEFESEVGMINRFAMANLAEKQWGVMLLGKVRRINPASKRHLWVDLSGRGFVVAVTIPTNQTPPNLDVGDEIAVFGHRVGLAPENSLLPRGVHNILAGLVVKVKLPPIPDDAALQAAYDLVTHDRTDQGFEDHVRKFVDVYPRILPILGKSSIRWQRIDLNGKKRQFDAVRFSVPNELHADLAWSFTNIDESAEAWGIIPVENFPMRDHNHFLTIRDTPVPGLAREEANCVHLQGLSRGLLVPGEDYLLWFAFKDAQPRRIAIAARLLPVGSFEEMNFESIGKVMKEGAPFKAEELAKMAAAMKVQTLAASTATKSPSSNAAEMKAKDSEEAAAKKATAAEPSREKEAKR